MNDQDLLHHLRQGLDASLAGLQGEPRRRLAQARHLALGGHEPASRRYGWPRAAAGLAGLVCAAAVILLFLVPRPGPRTAQLSAITADVDILSAEETLDFYQDLDFVSWLSQAAGGPS